MSAEWRIWAQPLLHHSGQERHVLLYTPCMVAIAAERQELGMKWMWVSIVGQFALAWIVAVAVFRGGILLGLG
jgi:Fe2+ transport system protein B